MSSMYAPVDTATFRKKMTKLRKKNRARFDRISKKMDEILHDPHHYKPLGNVMAGEMRVHIDPYVLTFEIDEANKKVIFLDFDHHDKIYKN
ncbi:MAG: type II toxin-antitoxin system RelE/ParE family toxin [Candidatus Micrarchaeota archaeon]|nr:type II toxin-antitoxin system RelE/ParE family toxin [Candidatus Micrarchaeota archaeon]